MKISTCPCQIRILYQLVYIHAEVIEVIGFRVLQKQFDQPSWRTLVSFQNKSRFGEMHCFRRIEMQLRI